MDTIRIVDKYMYHARIVFGLDVLAPAERWPLFIGCSLLTRQGEVVDQPARWLPSPGLALWDIKIGERRFQDNPGVPMDGWSGRVIFAMYPDDTFSERLADTGWVPWSVYWLIGSSTAALDMQDQEIRAKYGNRFDVWS
jgi:hypothetical protein